jgi:altronate hydrolase
MSAILTLPTVRLAATDNIVVAITDVSEGDWITESLVATQRIPAGHKVATAAIGAGEAVLKYGQGIGIATAAIAPGEHVHTHNLAVGDAPVMTRAVTSTTVTSRLPADLDFQGFRRARGRVGTRNQIGVIASVNCSATVVHAIVDRARQVLLPRFANIDGIAPIAHQSGCGMARGDEGFHLLERTMKGFLNHPNFGAVLVIGLGCEVTGSAELVPENADPERYRRFDIQTVGGTSAAVAAGIKELEALMVVADRDRRERVSASELTLGLQCGGSDGLSGVTANPAMGMAVDQLIAAGATALLLSGSTDIEGRFCTHREGRFERGFRRWHCSGVRSLSQGISSLKSRSPLPSGFRVGLVRTRCCSIISRRHSSRFC